MIQDLRFGFRMLRRAPGFSLLAILCLTLGIGANAAVFGWQDRFHGDPTVIGKTQVLAGLPHTKVSPRDPLVFGAATVVLATTAVAACLLPALRAMRTDPINALRS